MGAGASSMNRQRVGKIPNGPQEDKGFRERLNAAAEGRRRRWKSSAPGPVPTTRPSSNGRPPARR